MGDIFCRVTGIIPKPGLITHSNRQGYKRHKILTLVFLFEQNKTQKEKKKSNQNKQKKKKNPTKQGKEKKLFNKKDILEVILTDF